MPSHLRRRPVFNTLSAIGAAAVICAVSCPAGAAEHPPHARSFSEKAAAYVVPALNHAKQLRSTIQAEVVSSSKSVRRYARSLRNASVALATALLPAKAAATDTPAASQSSAGVDPELTVGAVWVKAVDERTAVYDITAHTVYLPDGRQLEAHSGLGKFRDDALSITEKNRGVTPPNAYQITLREQPFHGVQALRLTPVSDQPMYGRDGILAHTYMLGPSGQSNGCVVFKDYPAFLQAFLSREVDRLIVLTGTTAAPANTRVAAR
jgi:type VI secretion system (T6SS) effector TldE1-like protein